MAEGDAASSMSFAMCMVAHTTVAEAATCLAIGGISVAAVPDAMHTWLEDLAT